MTNNIKQKSYLNPIRSTLHTFTKYDYKYFLDNLELGYFNYSLNNNKNTILNGLDINFYSNNFSNNNNLFKIVINPGSGIIDNTLFEVNQLTELNIDLSVYTPGCLFTVITYKNVQTYCEDNQIIFQLVYVSKHNNKVTFPQNIEDLNCSILFLNQFTIDKDNNNNLFVNHIDNNYFNNNIFNLNKNTYNIYNIDTIKNEMAKMTDLFNTYNVNSKYSYNDCQKFKNQQGCM